jgi:hypothetical protein
VVRCFEVRYLVLPPVYNASWRTDPRNMTKEWTTLRCQAGLCEPSGDVVDVVQDADGVHGQVAGWSATCVDGVPQLSCQPMQVMAPPCAGADATIPSSRHARRCRAHRCGRAAGTPPSARCVRIYSWMNYASFKKVLRDTCVKIGQ